MYLALKHIYPELEDDKDFAIKNDGNGPYILYWNSELPQPTEEELLKAEATAVLNFAKQRKDAELNKACNEAILAGFTHVINGQTYWFSYDMEAQGNFRDGREILKDGIMTEVPWTVRLGGINGDYARIPITLEIMNELTLKIMEHKTGYISKYRDFLMPLVNGATTPEEVAEIVW